MLKPGLGSLSQLSWSTAPESGKECSSKARSYQPPPAPTTAVLRSNVSAGICLVQGLGSRGARSISEVGVAEAWAGEQVGMCTPQARQRYRTAPENSWDMQRSTCLCTHARFSTVLFLYNRFY